jgi:hypothetical protein
MKRIFAFGTGAALIAGMTLGALTLRAGDKVSVCHVEGLQSGRAHVIEVSINAVLKHLAHGDSLQGVEGLNPGESCVIPDPNSSADTTS